MQRYFVNQFVNDRFIISGDDYHHIVKVMRQKTGDRLFCTTTDGLSAVCQIAEITDEHVVADVVQWEDKTSELPISVTIASGLPKGDKLEWIIQKGTELGANEFIPYLAKRSVVKWDSKKADKKVERWQKIAKEAAEQSHRHSIPQIHHPKSLKELLEVSKTYTTCLLAFEEEAKQGETSNLVKALAHLKQGDRLLVIFGPEGGMSDAEVELLMENGFIPCGLGPRILRTETAPLFLLSAVSYQFELLR